MLSVGPVLTAVPPVAAVRDELAIVESFWGSNSSRVEVAPGDIGVLLSVVVQVVGNGSSKFQGVTHISAELRLPTGFRDWENPAREVSLAAVSRAVTTELTLRFLLNIEANAALGFYSTPVTISYEHVNEDGFRFFRGVVNFRLTGRSVLEGWVSTPLLRPGGQAPFTLTVSNAGTAGASNLDISLTAPSILVPVGASSHWTIPTLGSGAAVALTGVWQVSPAAAVATHALTLTVAYRDSVGVLRTTTRTLGVTIAVPEVEAIALDALLEPTSIAPGVDTLVSLRLRNTGNATAFALKATLTLPPGAPPPLAFVDADGRWEISRLERGATVTQPFTLHASSRVPNTPHLLSLSISYEDAQGVTRTTTHTLGLRVGSIELDRISFTVTLAPTQVAPGLVAPLELSLRNLGSALAQKVRVTVTLPQTGTAAPLALVNSDGHWEPGALAPGAATAISFTLYPSAGSANTLQPLTVTVDYEDRAGNAASLRRTLYVQVQPLATPDIQLDAQLTPTQLFPGAANELQLHIINRGREPATDLEVTLSLPAAPAGAFTLLGRGNQWRIAKLGAGETARFPMTIFLSSAAAATAPQFSVTFTYTDPLGFTRTTPRQLGAAVAGLVPTQRLQAGLDATLTAGMLNNATLRLRNLGVIPLRNVSLAVTAPRDFTLIGGDRFFLIELRAGQTVALPMTLFPGTNLAGSAVSLTLAAQYLDASGLTQLETLTLGTYVAGLLRITLVDVRVSRVAGETLVTGTVLNEGNVAALFTQVAVRLPTLNAEVGQPVYLGDLNPNAPLPFSVGLRLPSDASPGPYPIEVRVTYKDAVRVPHEAVLEASLLIPAPPPLTSQPPGIIDPLWLGGLIVVLVAIAVAVIRRRARRHRSGV